MPHSFPDDLVQAQRDWYATYRELAASGTGTGTANHAGTGTDTSSDPADARTSTSTSTDPTADTATASGDGAGTGGRPFGTPLGTAPAGTRTTVLRRRLVRLSVRISSHPYWATLPGTAPAARMELKEMTWGVQAPRP
jgi:hypothetical protein